MESCPRMRHPVQCLPFDLAQKTGTMENPVPANDFIEATQLAV